MTTKYHRTLNERRELEEKVNQILTTDPSNPPTMEEVRKKIGWGEEQREKGGFTRFIKSRFLVLAGRVYPKDQRLEKGMIPTYKEMIKVIDRMAEEIEALQKENTRLRQVGNSIPTLSERAKRALAVYGD